MTSENSSVEAEKVKITALVVREESREGQARMDNEYWLARETLSGSGLKTMCSTSFQAISAV